MGCKAFMITPTYSGNRQQKVPRLETAGGFSVCKKSARRGAHESEQIAMGTGAGQIQNQLRAVDLVDQQPVRCDMTFPTAAVITDELMVAVLGRQFFTGGKFFDHVGQECQIIAAFLDTL